METPKTITGRVGRATDIVERGRRFAPRRASQQNVRTPLPNLVSLSTSVTPGPKEIDPEKPVALLTVDNVRATTPVGRMGDIAPPKAKKQRTVSVVKPALPRQHRSLVLKRQIVEKAIRQQHTQRKHKQKRLKIYALSVSMAVAAVAALLVLFPIGQSGDTGDQAAVSGALGASTQSAPAVLDETPVTLQMIEEHTVAEFQPRLLIYQRLGLRSRIMPVGKNINDEPFAPANIFDVGWLSTSAVPGAEGAALLNGSVTGPSEEGVFRVLGRAAVGDLIQIELGDGTLKSFSVVNVVHYDADQVNYDALAASNDPARPGLNLLAMQGRFNAKTNQFEQRTAVFAVQVD